MHGARWIVYWLFKSVSKTHSSIEKLYKHQKKFIFQIEPWIFQTYCKQPHNL